MNFYAFHMGDYVSATRHLSWTEDLAYRRLIDAYYMREGPIPADKKQIYRVVLATSKAQRDAVDTVLHEYFTLQNGFYEHWRCDEEIAKAQIKRDKATQSANRRWGNANASADAMPTHNEGNAPNPNPNPIKEDISRKRDFAFSYPSRYEDFWKAYPTDPGMSKTEAFHEWERLSEDDRDAAFSALSGFRTWVSKQGKDYRVVHAVRYLKHRRFEGFAPATNGCAIINQQVPVFEGTPQWDAWMAVKKVPVIDLRIGNQIKRGWYFPTEFPPQQMEGAA